MLRDDSVLITAYKHEGGVVINPGSATGAYNIITYDQKKKGELGWGKQKRVAFFWHLLCLSNTVKWPKKPKDS